MAGFVWNAFRLRRAKNAIRSFNYYIDKAAKKLNAAGMGDYVGYLPHKMTLKQLKAEIFSEADFRRIVGYKGDAKRGKWSRMERVKRPDAMDFEETPDGGVATKYDMREERNNRRANERRTAKRRKAQETKMYDGDDVYNFDNMSAEEYARHMSDNDLLLPDEGELDDSVEDIDPETKRRWEREDEERKRWQSSVGAMYEKYRDAWTAPENMHESMGGYDRLLEALDWLYENAPNVLDKLFNGGYNEMDIQYIVISGGPSNPYIETPYDTRHKRAVDFLTKRADMVKADYVKRGRL